MDNANVNALTEKIEILTKAQKRTAHGAVSYDYVSHGTTWASVVGYNALYSHGTYETLNYVDYKIIVRYHHIKHLHKDDKVIYRNRTLVVQNEPVAVQGKKQFIYFNAKEMVEDG